MDSSAPAHESYEIPIERGKVREFAKATRAAAPEYDGPHPLIPPTFLTTARMTWENPKSSPLRGVGFDLRRVLHAGEEYVFLGRVPRAGETLRVSSRLEEVYDREGRRGGTLRFAVVVNDFVDESGVLVAQQRTTIVETAKAPVRDSEGSE